MPSINHHFVPQFYLRLFASDRRFSPKPKLINLYNIKRNMFIENASIRKQCYKRKFYGETDEIEKTLAEFENLYSILLSIITKVEGLPPKGSIAYSHLLFFTLLQKFRTKHHADIQNEMFDGIMKATYYDHEMFKDFDLDKYKIGIQDTILLSLSVLSAELATTIDDLEPCLVLLSGHKRFIVSDNPVFSYNQYFEWFPDMSNIGLVSKGLQLFFPLSPQCLLLLYDRQIYTVSASENIIHDITEKNLLFINGLQYINSDENIYFDSMSIRSHIETLVKGSKY